MTTQLGKDAGQVENLIHRLRGLIRDYPLGIGVFKEFLQNADDAKATRVSFTLDERHLDASALPDARMSALVGPALLVTNDSVFSERDLHAIQVLQEGHKRTDASTTGRFGLGFNSVYNVTDYPSFVTGGVIITFDPHRDAVATPAGRPGRQWTLEELWAAAPGWPPAFGLSERQAAANETTFRLPLRTPDQCGADRVGPTPVPPSVIEGLLREVADDWGGELLLFLRHVLHVELSIIGPDGATRWRATIETANEAEVAAARDLHGAPLAAKTIAEAWEAWQRSSEGLPEVVYEHHLVLTGATGREQRHAWLIALGAGLASRDRIFSAAKDLLKIDEKPLPVVGAACRLPKQLGGSLPATRGRLYCTLPLPDSIETPFHINAFVDLDSSRRAPTASDDLAGNARLRKNWNEAILSDLVPAVAGRLLAEVARRVGAGALDLRYAYQLCPRTRVGRHRWAESMVEALLRAFAQVRFVPHRAGAETSHRSAADSAVAPPEWLPGLRHALTADGFELAQPPPPQALIEAFESVGVCFPEVQPDRLGAWLTQVEGDHWASLPEAPLACLRTQPRIRSLIHFCARRSDGSLKGLPLGIKQDGSLLRFGSGMTIFFGWPEFRRMFPTRTHWFWGELVEQEVRPEQIGSPRMNPETVALNLKTYLGSTTSAWNREGDRPPNAPWLHGVLRYLAGSRLSEGALKALNAVALLPAADGRLHLGGPSSDLMVHVPAAIATAVAALGVTDTVADEPLKGATAALAAAHPGIARRCSGAAVRQLLVSAQPDRLTALSDAELGSIVDYIASEWAAPNPGPADKEELQRLRPTPLWRTIDGARASAASPNTFVAKGFTPPAGLVSITVIDSPRSKEVQKLQHALGLAPLTQESFAEALAPRLGEAGPLGERARGWLIGQPWGQWADDTLGDIGAALRVPARSGPLRSPGQLFDPKSVAELALLGDQLSVPADDYQSAPWLGLLRRLGMRYRLEATDLTRHIDSWLDGPSAREQSDRLIRWLDAACEGAKGNAEALGHLRACISPLAGKAWIFYAILGVFATTPVRSAAALRPDWCVTPDWQDLVGGVRPLFPIDISATLRSALSVQLKPTAEAVLDQLQRSLAQAGGEVAVERYSRALLRWLDFQPEVPLPLRQGAWIPCAVGRRSPSDVYLEDMRFAAPHFGQPSASLAPFHDTLRRVGVRDRPRMADLVRLLGLLRKETSPTPGHLATASHVYARLEAIHGTATEPWPEVATSRSWPAPTADGRLVPLQEAIYNDAPWLPRAVSEARAPWLAGSITPAFALTLGVRRASEVVEMELGHLGAPSPGSEALSVLRALVNDPGFRAALARLLGHKLDGSPKDILEVALRDSRQATIELSAHEAIEVDWRLDGQALARSNEAVYTERSAKRISVYFAGPCNQWYKYIARGLAQGLRREELFNDAALEELLQAQPGDDLGKILDDRRIRADPNAGAAVLAPLTGNQGAAPSPAPPKPASAAGSPAPDGPPRRERPPAGDEVHVSEHTRSLPGGGAGGAGRGATQSAANPGDQRPGADNQRRPNPGPNPSGSTPRPPPRAAPNGDGWHDVTAHRRRNRGSGAASARGWQAHPALTAAGAAGPKPSPTTDPRQSPTGGQGKTSAYRGAVRVVPDAEFTPSGRFNEVRLALGARSGAHKIEPANGKHGPDLWLTFPSRPRLAVFVCVIDGSWDAMLPDLRASAVPLLHKWGPDAELWVVEHIAGRDYPSKLSQPLDEAYTFRLGRQARQKVKRS